MIHLPPSARHRRAAARTAVTFAAALVCMAAPAAATTDPATDTATDSAPATEEAGEGGAAAEAEALHWTGGELADHVVLTWTETESGVDLLSLLCHRPTGVLTLQLRHEPSFAEPGMPVLLEIQAEGGQVVPLDARGVRFPASDAFIVEAQTTVTPELRRALTTDPGFELMVEDGSVAIPLAGSQPGMAAVLGGCSGL